MSKFKFYQFIGAVTIALPITLLAVGLVTTFNYTTSLESPEEVLPEIVELKEAPVETLHYGPNLPSRPVNFHKVLPVVDTAKKPILDTVSEK
jgi:hypothetical protein